MLLAVAGRLWVLVWCRRVPVFFLTFRSAGLWGRSRIMGATDGVFRIDGDGGFGADADCADAAARYRHREASGGGALMMRKPPSLRSIGIERDLQVIEAFVCDPPVELVHGCAHGFPSLFPFSGRDLVHSNPSYLQATRRSARRSRFDGTEADPVALLCRLKRLPCQVMVSGHLSAVWRDAAGDAGGHPGHGAEHGRVVHLRARPDAAGALRGSDLHRPPAHHAQGGRPGRRSAALLPGERLAVLSAMMAIEAETP